MSLNTLKWLRLVGPGFMAVALSLPMVFYFGIGAQSASALNAAAGPAAAIAFGIVYTWLDIRGELWRAELRDYVGEQIRRAILELAPENLKLTMEEEQLIRDRAIGPLGGIFWEAVESDAVLKSQKEHFYASGFLYTASIDTLIIGFLAGMVYSLAFYIKRYDWFEWTALFSMAAGFFALFVGIPQSRENTWNCRGTN